MKFAEFCKLNVLAVFLGVLQGSGGAVEREKPPRLAEALTQAGSADVVEVRNTPVQLQ